MARVVVVGGGFGGLASAARLAKLGHDVTLLERGRRLGGALVPVEADGFAWDVVGHTLLPAVVRDLFRKSGRPAERELELVPLDPIRDHWFEDGTSLELRGGSRAAQVAAFDALEPGLGEAWARHVEAYADDWEVLRRHYLEVPWDRDHLPREVAARLRSRETLERRLRALQDPRARLVAAHPHTIDGHHLRDVPAWAGLVSYLEQRFGAWTVEGGMGVLADVLTARLATRKVTVELGTTARDLVVRDGRAVAVSTDAGDVDADVVVVAVDPRTLPALAPLVKRTTPAIPPAVHLLGLASEGLPDLAQETVVHGGPTLVVRRSGRAPEGHEAWTVLVRGSLSEDVTTALARQGLDVRERLVTAVAQGPRELVERWHGSPLGVAWQGRATVLRRLGPDTPVRGVYAAGAHATPGAGLPFTGLSGALVAQAVGPA